MKNTTKLDPKKLTSFALKEHLKKKNWGKIEELLPFGESQGVSNRLLQKSWIELAYQQKEDDALVSAILSFVAARKFNTKNDKLFIEIVDCLSQFVLRYCNTFSKEDLVFLKYGLDRIYTYENQINSKKPSLFPAKKLQVQIDNLLISAKSKPETKSTYNVQRIYDALYTYMTPEEVRSEFAKLFFEANIDEYEKRVREKKKLKKKPSASGGKKPPKDNGKDSSSDERL